MVDWRMEVERKPRERQAATLELGRIARPIAGTIDIDVGIKISRVLGRESERGAKVRFVKSESEFLGCGRVEVGREGE